MHWIENMHNCVLSNAGLSNALTKTGVCTSLKSDFYFRFQSPLNAKSAVLNFICTWDLLLICWKMWSPEPENCRNCRNRNPHISKIGKLLPVCLTNNRRRSDHIFEPHAKFGENWQRILDVILNRNQIRNLHISKIQFLFPVSFTIGYKVGIAEFYLCVGFGADLLKNMATRPWKLPKSESAHL